MSNEFEIKSIKKLSASCSKKYINRIRFFKLNIEINFTFQYIHNNKCNYQDI